MVVCLGLEPRFCPNLELIRFIRPLFYHWSSTPYGCGCENRTHYLLPMKQATYHLSYPRYGGSKQNWTVVTRLTAVRSTIELSSHMELDNGLEPLTYALQVGRSTNWANPAYRPLYYILYIGLCVSLFLEWLTFLHWRHHLDSNQDSVWWRLLPV